MRLKTTAWLIVMSILLLPPLVEGQSVPTEIKQLRKFEPIQTEKGLIISTREVRLKSDVDPKVFEKWINEYWNLEWQHLIPGFKSYVAKEEQTNDLYTYYLIFNSKRTRNPNFPVSDQSIEWYRELIYYEPTKHLYDELFKYIEIDVFFTNTAWSEIK